MKTMMCKRRAVLFLLLLCVAALSGTGCARSSDPAPGTPAKPAVVNISYSTRPLNVPAAVALEKHFFEEAFAAEGIAVQWYLLEGPATVEALAAKSIDIATSLNYVSAIVTKAGGNDIKVIASYNKFPKGIGLLAGTDSGVVTVADLKGKKVALQKGTMLQEMLIKALVEAGLNENDVELISMESADAANALVQNQVAAAVLPDPLLTKMIGSQQAKLLRNAEGLILGQAVIAARSDFAAQYPDVVQKVLEAEASTLEWIDANTDEALEIMAATNQMELAGVRALYPKFDFTLPIDAGNIDSLKSSAEFLQAHGFLKPETDTRALIDALVDTSYLK
ncbi:MAG: aliphatic sulfonate ABC transporter substrate-binding protein [Peptococcaceae bacterium]|nr:aliphatic sulfonate ABC transporter substrate-binding protein [Peptococcaceae bacterium]